MKEVSSGELMVASGVGRKILFYFFAFYLCFSIFMLSFKYFMPSGIYFCLSMVYLFALKQVERVRMNHMIIALHCVTIIYVITSVAYFGWSYGAQYFLIPCIAFSYVGQFRQKSMGYFIAFAEAIVFELLYFFSVIQNESAVDGFVIGESNYNNVFYFLHSFLTCVLIIVVMYYLRVKLYQTMEDKVNLNESLSQDANTDTLTNLLNRWAFIDKIKQIQASKNANFAMIDLDFFKKVNDTYGHNVGDEVLKTCAILIKKHFRTHTKLISRWGGEEFLLFAADCDKDKFYKKCEAFRKNLESYVFKSHNFSVTASIGCLHLENEFKFENFDANVKEVDDLLYEAKNNGRNQTKAK